MTTAQHVLEVARGYMGAGEGGSLHAKILSIYNNHKPLPQNYRVRPTDDWCDTFVSAMAIEAGAYDAIGAECGVERHVAIFQKKGIWVENDNYLPKPGDIIVYNWNSGDDNVGFADHIGYVEQVQGTEIVTIEGNKGDRVSRRWLQVGDNNIRGFAVPNYSGVTNPVKPSTPKPTPAKPAPVSAKKQLVMQVQAWVGSAQDGVNGPDTKRKLLKRYQHELNAQFGAGLTEDGYWGPRTKRATVLIRQGAKGNLTKCVQAALMLAGYSTNGFDGNFGSGTAVALRAWQGSHGKAQDAIVGGETAEGLFS